MPAKKPTARSRRRVKDERYIIALGKDKKTIYVAGEVATFTDPDKWQELAKVRGPAANVVVKTLVADDRPGQVALLGGNLGPPRVPK
jgi:hypothetical protein